MKVTLEFNMEDDEYEFRNAIDGYKWCHIVSDLDGYLRSIVKYTPDGTPGEVVDFADELREKLREMCADWKVVME